jgi:hypothetical protein
LPGLEARIGLANDVNAPPTTNDLAVGMAVLEGLEGGDDFHGEKRKKLKKTAQVSTGIRFRRIGRV